MEQQVRDWESSLTWQDEIAAATIWLRGKHVIAWANLFIAHCAFVRCWSQCIKLLVVIQLVSSLPHVIELAVTLVKAATGAVRVAVVRSTRLVKRADRK